MMNYGIKVTLINPKVLENLYYNHGLFAATCYNTPTDNPKVVSGSRCEYIKFVIEADRGTLEQILRNELGVRPDPQDIYIWEDLLELNPRVSPDEIVKNMASFRYIDKDGFDFATPLNIEKVDEANERYCALMNYIDNERRD